MGPARPLSPAARGRLHTGSTVWSLLLLGLWFVVTAGLAVDRPLVTVLSAQGWLWPVLAGGLALLANGLRGRRSARRFDVEDAALADALTASLDGLCRTDRFAAYRVDPSMPEVRDARLVGLDRHLDQQIAGRVVGGTVHASARDSLMGDAFAAVVEAAGPAGPRDTFRVVTTSPSATAGWVQALVLAEAARLGGPQTHAGATLIGWSGTLVRRFGPQDVAYAADRLRAQTTRGVGPHDLLTVRGPAVGRNALLAAHLQIGGEPPLLLFPVQLPALLGHAIAAAVDEAGRGRSARFGTTLLRPAVLR